MISTPAVLETIGKVTLVAFDNTGTLTESRPKVTDVIALGKTASEVLTRAAALETGSSHPLAKAMLDRAATDQLTIPAAIGLAAIGGKGIVGTVDGQEHFLGSPQVAETRGAMLNMLSATESVPSTIRATRCRS